MIWPFKRKKPPTMPIPNEAWMAGDEAECIVDGEWTNGVAGPDLGDVLVVRRVIAGRGAGNGRLGWGLGFSFWLHNYDANCFRKVRRIRGEAAWLRKLRAKGPARQKVDAI